MAEPKITPDVVNEISDITTPHVLALLAKHRSRILATSAQGASERGRGAVLVESTLRRGKALTPNRLCYVTSFAEITNGSHKYDHILSGPNAQDDIFGNYNPHYEFVVVFLLHESPLVHYIVPFTANFRPPPSEARR